MDLKLHPRRTLPRLERRLFKRLSSFHFLNVGLSFLSKKLTNLSLLSMDIEESRKSVIFPVPGRTFGNKLADEVPGTLIPTVKPPLLAFLLQRQKSWIFLETRMRQDPLRNCCHQAIPFWYHAKLGVILFATPEQQERVAQSFPAPL